MRAAGLLGRAALTALVLSSLGAAFVRSGLEVVPAGHVGVRLDADRGVVERDFAAGIHRAGPLFGHGPAAGRWLLVPAGARTTEFSTGSDAAPLEIRTSDDQTARVAAVALWRVVPGRSWRLVAAGLDAGLEGRVRDAIEDVLRTELAVLGSEEWFAVARRREVLDGARPSVAAALAELDVELVDVQLLEVEFSQEYARKLQAKQAAVQQARRVAAEEAVARVSRDLKQLQQEALTELARLEGEAQLARVRRRAEVEAELAALRSEAERSAAEIRAAAERAHAEAVAAGEQALAEAAAEAERARLAALARPGGRAWLARRAALALNLGRVVLDPGDATVGNLLDLDRLQALLE